MRWEGKEAPLSPPAPEGDEAIVASAELDWSDRDAVLANRIHMFKTLSGSAYPYDPNRDEIFAAEIDRAISFASTTNHGPAIAPIGVLARTPRRVGLPHPRDPRYR